MNKGKGPGRRAGRLLSAAASCAFCVCIASAARAAIYWVSPAGAATWANCQSGTPLAGGAACSLATANQNASAGDIVYFRDGNYVIASQYGYGLNPKNSGTVSSPITFMAYGNEKPAITASADNTYAIVLSNNAYIKIDGLTVKNTNVWMYIVNNSHHNEVVNSTFQNDTGEEGGFGLDIWDMCAGGQTYTCPSSHNWIHHNTFARIHAWPAGQSCVEGADLVRIGGDGTGESGGNDYNTIEDNSISYGGHALFDSYGRYTVFRNNTLHNEPWITDYSSGTCHHPSIYVNPAYDGKFGHRGMQITGSLYPGSGTWDLVENNRVGYAGVNPNNPGAINFEVAAPKNIIRLNYFYGSMRLGLGFKYSYSGDNRLYRNTFYHNGFGYDWQQYDPANDDRGQIKAYTPDPRINIIKDNITYDSPVGTPQYGYWWGDIMECSGYADCENNWLTANGDPLFMNPDLSDTRSPILPDLSLRSASPAIDRGASLTQAKGSGGNSTTLVVGDAMYFQDGTWGSDLARGVTLFPDWIAVGSVNNVAQVAAINYAANTITLKSPISWPDAAPVWLYKDSSGRQVLYGSAPDVGASEYVSSGHRAASCSQSDVQSAIDSASPGDTIIVPAGTCTYTTVSAYTPSVKINKAVTVQGQTVCTGRAATLSCADGTVIVDNTGSNSQEVPFSISASSARLSGFTITGGTAGDWQGAIEVGTGPTDVRIDHNKISLADSAVPSMKAISFYGNTGLADHNYITTADDGFTVTGGSRYDVKYPGDYNWTQPLGPGSANCVYIEDNEFNFKGVYDGAWDSYGGARICFRYNDIQGTNMGGHGLDSGGYRSTLLQEVYNNTWTNNGPATFSWAGSRGGTFFIFNNTVNASGGSYNVYNDLREYREDTPYAWGLCNGSDPIDQNMPGQYGYACQDQVGRGSPNANGFGTPEPLYPGYMWGNSWKGRTPAISDVNIANGSNCSNDCTPVRTYQILNNRDFYIEAARFDGTSGTGSGLLSARPTTCTPGVAFWASDQGPQGTLYQCSAPNTWTAYYQPYTYPHPLQGGGGDTTPPGVAISSPANGATVSGTITVSGTASDNVAASNVAVSIDGGAYSPASGTTSWSFSLDTTKLSNAAHTVTAKATDSSGNTATTQVSVTVNNPGGGDGTPPTVSISTPGDHSNVSGTVTLSANALDNVGVVRVDFYDNGGLISSIKAPPFTTTWKTANKRNGSAHTLAVVATDAAGNQGSASVTVTVSNALSANATVPGLRQAYVYPSPAVRGQDPVIRALLGWADGVEVSIYDLNGRLVNSAKLDGAPTGIMNGEYYYDYPWTGAKSSGIYFAVIHGKSSDGAIVRARVRFAVVK